MPYIDHLIRNAIDEHYRSPETAGELNYAITDLIDSYLLAFGSATSYDAINEVIGVLECAKMELYRRIAAPYEDRKCRDNGDVYSRVPAPVPA